MHSREGLRLRGGAKHKHSLSPKNERMPVKLFVYLYVYESKGVCLAQNKLVQRKKEVEISQFYAM